MWKDKILGFAGRFQHPAWGITHLHRVYNLSLILVPQKENIDIELLFAAAYMHDAGSFKPFKKDGVDHAERSSEVADEYLKTIDFPKEKIPAVKEIIKGHMYYSTPSSIKEALILHDADTLDFMGYIGISRFLSIVGLESWTPDVKSAITLIQEFSEKLPENLYTEKAREIGKVRKREMEEFLQGISNQTDSLNHL